MISTLGMGKDILKPRGMLLKLWRASKHRSLLRRHSMLGIWSVWAIGAAWPDVLVFIECCHSSQRSLKTWRSEMNFVAQGGDLRIPAQATIEWVRVEHHLVLRSTSVGSCQYATSCIPKDSGVVLGHLYIRVVRMLAATKKSRPEYNGSLEYGQIEYSCSATHVSRPNEDIRGKIRGVSSDSFPKKSSRSRRATRRSKWSEHDDDIVQGRASIRAVLHNSFTARTLFTFLVFAELM